ncbi:MAG: cytochrome c [Betaproteobacteria bacterium]|nr:cytochrome c [Betaproteobacteria bacterium]MDH5222218.1 cytochrome c [Betaproteobacteria bacterium]MDH5351605.1 cytochrome c [Betaproteobacteria bacterium]
MFLRSRYFAAAACALLACASPAALAQGAKAGDASIRGQLSLCAGCHGIPGYKTAYPVVYHVPKIGGQSPTYIANALKAYRSGDRQHPSMRGIAASLSDAQIEQIAAYYGGGK